MSRTIGFRRIAPLLALLALLLTAAPAAADVNGFEGGDGNQACDAATDWACLPSGDTLITVDDATGSNDNTFTSGSKEEQPGTWDLISSSANDKTDVGALWVAPQELADASYLRLAFWRTGGQGNAFFSFELNQAGTSWDNGNDTIPCRTDGDLLLSYEIGSTGDPVSLKLYVWQGSGGPAECPDGATGNWATPPGGSAVTPPDGEGAINNTGSLTNTLSSVSAPGTLAASTFGEAAVDLGAMAAQAGITRPCEFFRSLQAHSRSSESFSSDMKDFVPPTGITVPVCRPPGGGGNPPAPTMTPQLECPARDVTLSGTGLPGHQVQVREGLTTVGFADVDANGNWSLKLTGVSEGSHTYNARQRDAAANVSPTTEVTILVSCPGDGGNPPTGDGGTTEGPFGPIAEQQPSLNQQPSAGCVSRPFTVFISRRGGVRRVAYFVDGRRMKVVRRANRQGNFVFRVDPAIFTPGRHRIRARVTERRGRRLRRRMVPMRSFTLCNLGPCVSRRLFRIRVRNQPGTDDAVRATIFVNGRRVKVVRGRRLTAPVRLTGLPQGRFRVRIVAVTRSGRVVRETRRYRTCVPTKRRRRT